MGLKLYRFWRKLNDIQLPCLVVLDYNMPGSNGAEILKVLKDNSRYDYYSENNLEHFPLRHVQGYMPGNGRQRLSCQAIECERTDGDLPLYDFNLYSINTHYWKVSSSKLNNMGFSQTVRFLCGSIKSFF